MVLHGQRLRVDATMLQQMERYNTCKYYHFLCILTQLMLMFIPRGSTEMVSFFSLSIHIRSSFFLLSLFSLSPFISLHLFLSSITRHIFTCNMLFTFCLRYIKTTRLQSTKTVCAINFFPVFTSYCFFCSPRLVKVAS